ncbi:unnamed protein product [Bursaphelenchus okinawaensis]|uniref:Uncharacterized protein n=1 Tax=Bursaphelenchus okinawaensis TaxID=465554 RepID=A0A811KDN0_9BILA|nr:unnamed protein product [Bursaphelenchus okinawaensis]CAG9101766.1 unnamed protein product [Bursaphelenchus okinawaensis]
MNLSIVLSLMLNHTIVRSKLQFEPTEFAFYNYQYHDHSLLEVKYYGSDATGFKEDTSKRLNCSKDCGEYMNVRMSMSSNMTPNVIGIKKVRNTESFEISVLKGNEFVDTHVRTNNTAKVYLLNDIVIVDQTCDGRTLRKYNITSKRIKTTVRHVPLPCVNSFAIDNRIVFEESGNLQYLGFDDEDYGDLTDSLDAFRSYSKNDTTFTGFFRVKDFLRDTSGIDKNLHIQFIRNDAPGTITSTAATNGTSTRSFSSTTISTGSSTTSTISSNLPNEATTILSDSEFAASQAANLLKTCSLTKVLYDYHNVLDIDVIQYDYDYENKTIMVNYYRRYLTQERLTSLTIHVNESMTSFVAFLTENGQNPFNFYFSYVKEKETRIYSHINNTITLLAKTETGQALVIHDKLFTYDCNDKYYLYAFDGTRFMPLWNRDDFDCAYQVSTGDEFRIFVTKGHICMSAVPGKTVTRFKECEFFKFNYFSKARLAQTRFLSLYHIATMAECGLSLSDNDARSIFIRFVLKPKKSV